MPFHEACGLTLISNIKDLSSKKSKNYVCKPQLSFTRQQDNVTTLKVYLISTGPLDTAVKQKKIIWQSVYFLIQ